MTRKAILSLGTAVLTLGLLAGGEASAETYRLMTGPQGGVWVPLGGAFKDMWLTFTNDSHIDILKGDLLAKMNQVRRNVGYDTNIESAFRSILKVAVDNRVAAEDMPKYLLVLSDMEFNPAYMGGNSVGAWELATKMFEAAGYQLPKLVWWNLNARPDATGNSPVRFDQRGTAMVSGFSPSIMKSILAAKNFSPRDVMLETIMAERYQAVSA